MANPAPGLTQKELDQRTKQYLATKYGPAQRQLAAQGPRNQDYYHQYVNIIGQAGKQAGADTAQAVGGVQNLQQGLDTASQNVWAGQQASIAKDAATRGAQVSSTLADQAHNASNVRNSLTGGYGALLQTTGANQQHYLGDRGTIAKQQGIESAQRTQGQRRELAQERGADAASFRQQAIDDANKAAARAADQAYRQSLDQARLNMESQRIGIAQQNANAHDRSVDRPRSSGTVKDPYGNTPLQQRSHTSSFRNIQTNAAQIHKIHPEYSWQQVVAALTPDYSTADADVLTGAVQHAVLGRVGPETEAGLRRLGIDPSRYQRVQRLSRGGSKIVKRAIRL